MLPMTLTLLAQNRRTVTAALEKVGFTLNEHKTKYMASATKEAARREPSVSVDISSGE